MIMFQVVVDFLWWMMLLPTLLVLSAVIVAVIVGVILARGHTKGVLKGRCASQQPGFAGDGSFGAGGGYGR